MPIFARRIFRFGPIFIVPLMVMASYAFYPLRHYDSLPAYIIIFGLPVVAAWHLALVIMERPKLLYLGYALLNCVLYLYFGFFCIFWVTGDAI
jgi:hypothetical protein